MDKLCLSSLAVIHSWILPSSWTLQRIELGQAFKVPSYKSSEDRSTPNLHIQARSSTKPINNSRSQLLAIRRIGQCVPSHQVLCSLKNNFLLRFQGCRVGRRSIPVRISTKRVASLNSTQFASQRKRYFVRVTQLPSEPTHCKVIPKCLVLNSRSIAKPGAVNPLQAELSSNFNNLCFISDHETCLHDSFHVKQELDILSSLKLEMTETVVESTLFVETTGK